MAARDLPEMQRFMEAAQNDTAATQRLLDRLAERVRCDPLFQQYAQSALAHTQTGRDFRHTAPWMAQGERLYTVAMLAFPETSGLLKLDIFGGRTEQPHAWVRATIGMLLMMAATYYWSNEIDAVARELPLPRHVIGRAMPHPIMFMSTETAHRVRNAATGESLGGDMNWMLLVDRGDQLDILSDIQAPSEDRYAIVGGTIKYGQTYPDDFRSGGMIRGTETVLRKLAFINSPYIEKASVPLPRTIRRRVEAVRKEDASHSTIVLRRALPTPSGAAQQATGGASGFNHQWWVSGHIRAQWYPSEKAHRLIWIAPYIKGPPDKPMKQQTYAVVR